MFVEKLHLNGGMQVFFALSIGIQPCQAITKDINLHRSGVQFSCLFDYTSYFYANTGNVPTNCQELSESYDWWRWCGQLTSVDTTPNDETKLDAEEPRQTSRWCRRVSSISHDVLFQMCWRWTSNGMQQFRRELQMCDGLIQPNVKCNKATQPMTWNEKRVKHAQTHRAKASKRHELIFCYFCERAKRISRRIKMQWTMIYE